MSPLNGAADDQLTPVRMLAQYAYCPRLAYLEWVQKEWADNYFSEDGHFTHRRVDAYTEAVEAPTTRALNLSAPKEGFVTKLDVLEQDSGTGVSVEYKRGKTPRDGPRESELVQLCAQALILRENGWHCDTGYLYYSGSKERYEVPISDDLIHETRLLHREMKAQFAAQVIPAPLVNDRRCGDCSLNSICLPEEVNYLRRASESVRPLWAAHEEGHPLHVSENGSKIGISGEQLVISLKGEIVEEFRPLVADSVVLTLFNTKQLTNADFFFAGHGCSLKQRAKKTLLAAFERRMSEELTHPIFGYKASYRRTLTLQARLLARHLTGELESYPGLETR